MARCLAALVCGLLAWGFLAASSSGAGLADAAGKARKTVSGRDEADAKGLDRPTNRLRPYTGPKKRLGVMDMEVKIATSTAEPTPSGGVISTTTISIPPPADFGSGLTEMLTTALVETGRFVLLERKALTDIQAEQALAAGGSVNPASAPPPSQLLGAQALIRGAVTEYTYKRSSVGGNASFLQGIGVGASRAQAAVVLDVRLYEVATGQILDSVKAEGRASASANAVDIDKAGFKMSASGFSQTPLGHATRQAIERAVAFICKRMEELPWEGRIAELDAENGQVSSIYINAGSEMGLKVGDNLEILRPGRPIVDPETRLVIGRARDKRLGSCRLETVAKSLAIALPTEGQDFQAGDIVRLIEAKRPTKPQ